MKRETQSRLGSLIRGWQLSDACKRAAREHPGAELRRLLKRDYGHCLRRHIGHTQLRSLLAAFREIFPHFNLRPVAMLDGDDFRQIARRVGVQLHTARYEQYDGLELRGFYVAEVPGYLERPLIFVNTAHQQLAAGTAFIHELGHHAGTRLHQISDEKAHYFVEGQYSSHLDDATELAADVMVSLAGYPRKVARRIFPTASDKDLVVRGSDLNAEVFGEVRQHLKRSYGFDLPFEEVPEFQRLRHLTAMIHYAKLRWALLTVFNL